MRYLGGGPFSGEADGALEDEARGVRVTLK